MHKYKNLFFSVLIFLVACGGDKIPKDVIGGDKMVQLLTQVHIIDGSMYNVMQMPDSLYKYGSNKYLALFKRYGTDSVQFKNSFKYYSAHPELMAQIYEQVTLIIKAKTDSLNKINQAEIAARNKRMTDSLKKLPKSTPPQPAIASPTAPKPVLPNRYRTIKKKRITPQDK